MIKVLVLNDSVYAPELAESVPHDQHAPIARVDEFIAKMAKKLKA